MENGFLYLFFLWFGVKLTLSEDQATLRAEAWHAEEVMVFGGRPKKMGNQMI